MIRITELKLPLDHDDNALSAAIIARLKIRPNQLTSFNIHKRSYDARKKRAILLIYTVDVDTTDNAKLLKKLRKDKRISKTPDMRYRYVAQAPATLEERPVVIGSGPCGIFAALLLAQMGFRPIVLERGQPVRQRTKDTFAFWRKRQLNPESNVQYGEGGAGTFSDGKLYSQIRDPHFIGRKVLQEFVNNGADPEILYVSKPHIGTLRLVKIVETMRNAIIDLGGEYRFGTKVVDIIREDDQVRGVVLENGETLHSSHVVLAIGHSARDTFQMLHERGVYIEPKPFSIGFRIEHPQSMIDKARFGPSAGHPTLGAADYKLVHHCDNGRSVYSFCMCPGGVVVAAASEPGGVVTNGMSYYSRVERNANSAVVVGLTPDDYPGHPLAGIDLQRRLERAAFKLGGENYSAPGQLIGDFLAGRPSQALDKVEPSFQPSVQLTDLTGLLPEFAVEAIREALVAFGRKIPGFDRPDAILTAVETRTSSPIRIKRDKTTFQSLNTLGLFPAGEGAGYAGGIFSAGVDGVKVAQAVALSMTR